MTMLRLLAILLPLFSLSRLAVARLPDGRLHANLAPRPAVPPVTAPSNAVVHATTAATIPPYNTTYIFEQLIDHTDPSLGKFQQRYWHTWEFYESGKALACRSSSAHLMIPAVTQAGLSF